MNWPKCSFDYGMRGEEFNFCPKCGERLPGLPQLSQAAWRRVQLMDLVFSIVRLVAPGLLGEGIALWFMGPAWFVYTETRTIRAISIGLMTGGPLLFVLALFARKLAVDIVLRGAAKSSDDRPANIYLLLEVSGSMEGSRRNHCSVRCGDPRHRAPSAAREFRAEKRHSCHDRRRELLPGSVGGHHVGHYQVGVKDAAKAHPAPAKLFNDQRIGVFAGKENEGRSDVLRLPEPTQGYAGGSLFQCGVIDFHEAICHGPWPS